MVDLPAPFSPTRACTRPGRMVMSALRMARTAPKRFEMPVQVQARCRLGGGLGRTSDGAPGAGAREGWSTVMVSGSEVT